MRIGRVIMCAVGVVSTAACAGLFGIDEITYEPDPGLEAGAPIEGGAGDDGSTTADNHPSIAGTVLWLDVSNGVNDPSDQNLQPLDQTSVTVWRDTSTRGHDVRASTSAAIDPVFFQSDYSGFPDVDFSTTADDGGCASLLATNDNDFHFGTGDFSIFVVAGYQETQSGPFVSEGLNTAATNGFSFVPVKFETRGTADASADFSVETSETYDDGAQHVFVARRYSDADAGTSTLEIRVDGVSIATTAGVVPVDVSTNDGLVIGSLTDQPFNGAMAELVIVNGPILQTDFTTLENYLIELSVHGPQ